MECNDFRDYLDNLEKQGMLLKVTKEVSPRFEVAAGVYKTGTIGGPALLFENIKGHPGWRVAGGLFISPKLVSFALQAEDGKQIQRYLDIEHQRVKPVTVSSGPVKEIIIKGDDIDLGKIPFLTYCQEDELPYHHAGIQIAKHPVTGIQNASIHRMAILDKNTIGLGANPKGHLGLMIEEAEKQGKGLEIATVIGAHPALTIPGGGRMAPAGVDEIEIAGALRGKPFEIVKCETIDVLVPADAEVIIEGVLLPGERVIEGTWGGERGNYILLSPWYKAMSGGKLVKEIYVLKVTAITMRQNPVYVAMTTGMAPAEDKFTEKWHIASDIYQLLSGIVPVPEDIRDINVTLGTHVVIAIHKRDESTPRNIIYAVLATLKIIKRVVVVDEDINVNDPVDIDWAMLSRVSPEQDIIIIPSPDVLPTLGKWGIDATAPATRDNFGERLLYEKAVPPDVDEVDYI
ncbi:UbiD family decarboxylase [Chloroflexota bacterium]